VRKYGLLPNGFRLLNAPRQTLAALAVALLLMTSLQIRPARAAAEDEVRAAFDQFVVVQNAHDGKKLASLLLDAPDFLWITRGAAVWGYAEAMKRFEALYAGTWKLEPDMAAFRIVVLRPELAQLYVPIDFTIGAPGQAAQTTRFLMNQTLVKGAQGWKVASILPIPVPPPAPAK
jgi:Domain of unknown function (DUF4440)